jgi:hypothetical protein
MYKEYELINCYKSAKLPVYIPKRIVGAQPLIQHLYLGSLRAKRSFQSWIKIPIENTIA